ncbi:MAG TPA: SDR family oxidoreductase, partial [Woeseiaceae bacterium]|nr:SDR family oxidoreductase [Woeseiaceae bacterium]
DAVDALASACERAGVRRFVHVSAIGADRASVSRFSETKKAGDDALAAEPASVQERWFARMYFVKPTVFVIFSAFWIITGLISLGPGWDAGIDYMERAGAGPLAAPVVVAGALVDVLIGIGVAIRRTARTALYAALALSVFYLVTATVVLPELWVDPAGSMMKIWPILALNLVALAIVDDR